MDNPFDRKTRQFFYIAGIVLGVISAGAGAVVVAAENNDLTGVILGVIGILYAASNALAQANLSPEKE